MAEPSSSPRDSSPNLSPNLSPGMSDDDVITMWGLVIEAYAATNAKIEAHLQEIFELPVQWFEVMLRLHRAPDQRIPMTQLAREVAFSSGGFTKLADRMEAGGYIARSACPGDRRVTWLGLTELGSRTIGDAMVQHAQWLRDNVVAAIGPDVANELASAMRTLRELHSPE